MSDGYIHQPVGHKELKALRRVAAKEESEFFSRNSHLVKPYRSRLIAAALCQGAALQYLGQGHGVKDFDVHFFYSQNPTKPRLSRTVKRISAGIGAFPDIQVDFVRTIIPYEPAFEQTDSIEQIRRFLGSPRTQNALHLARQPVIGLLPDDLFNVIIWRTEGPVNQGAHGSADLETQYRDMASDAAHEREA